MKRAFTFLLLLCSTSSYGAGFLQAQKFPTVFSDLPFTERIKIKQDGYDDWASEYDSNGVCISNCSYQGITIADELEIMRQATLKAQNALQNLGYISNSAEGTGRANTSAGLIAANVQDNGWTYQDDLVIGTQSVVVDQTKRCQPNNPAILAGQTVPFGYPLMGQIRITSPFGLRIMNGKQEPHKGVDFSAVTGTDVYATASGTARVWTDSRCGNGLAIKHSNGFETVFCHLSKVLVKNGDKVEAGCLVAQTGNTGRTTGPHLHYAVKHNGDYIDPKTTFKG